MNDSTLSISGLVDLALPKGGAFREHFERELLQVRASSDGPTISITMAESPAEFHQPLEKIGTTGAIHPDGRYLFADRRGHFAFVDIGDDLELWKSFNIEVCCPSFSAAVLLEWVVLPLSFFPLATQGFCPLHASGISLPHNSQAFVFSAWEGVGKTNLILYRLQRHQDAVYLGDDSVTVHADGTALPSSRTISLYGYNEHLVPWLNMKVKSRMRLGETLRRSGVKRRGRFGQVAQIVGNKISNTRLALDRITDPAFMSPVEVTTHFILRSSSRGSARRTVWRGSVEDAASAHLAALDYEHAPFQRYLQGWRWASGTRGLDAWARLRESWTSILVDYFESVGEIAMLEMPPTQTAHDLGETWRVIERSI